MDEKVRDQDGAVLTCTVTDCTYNRSLECFAPSIQVGAEHPRCDTYTHSSVDLGMEESFVAMCMTKQCDFNTDSHCMARGITLDCHEGHADCATFRV